VRHGLIAKRDVFDRLCKAARDCGLIEVVCCVNEPDLVIGAEAVEAAIAAALEDFGDAAINDPLEAFLAGELSSAAFANISPRDFAELVGKCSSDALDEIQAHLARGKS
jgi:hypothetical protein